MTKKEFSPIWKKLSDYFDDKRPSGVVNAYYDALQIYSVSVVNEAADLIMQTEQNFGRVPDISTLLIKAQNIKECKEWNRPQLSQEYKTILEEEAETQRQIENCPKEIAGWNRGFLGVMNRLLVKEKKKVEFGENDIQELREWWDHRKKLEKETNCPEFWKFNEHYYHKTIENISSDLLGKYTQTVETEKAQQEFERIKGDLDKDEPEKPMKDIPF